MSNENGATSTTALEEQNVEIAVIGGSGVYKVDGLKNVTELHFETPFGFPSSKIFIGVLGNTKIAFLARHDTTHRLLPSEIPFKANIYALKMIGVKYILSFGSCGSLKEEVRPLDVVLVDQFIDNTKLRSSTFFGNGIIAHVAMGDPVCNIFTNEVKKALEKVKREGTKVHPSGTYVCIEGPQFSTKAESHWFRRNGGEDIAVIGMTAVTEAKLAKEAEIAFTCVALVTDYDCWHPDHESVTVELVLNNLKQNGDLAQSLVKELAQSFDSTKVAPSKSHSALQCAILTHKEHIPQKVKENLKYIIGKYV